MAAVSTLTVVLTWHIATIKDTGVDSENIRNAVQMPIVRIGRKDPTTRTASADISKVNLFPKFNEYHCCFISSDKIFLQIK